MISVISSTVCGTFANFSAYRIDYIEEGEALHGLLCFDMAQSKNHMQRILWTSIIKNAV